MSDKLKPCPFCGGDAHLKYIVNEGAGVTHYGVNCCYCSVEKVWFEDQGRAVKIWNTRTDIADELAAALRFCITPAAGRVIPDGTAYDRAQAALAKYKENQNEQN